MAQVMQEFARGCKRAICPSSILEAPARRTLPVVDAWEWGGRKSSRQADGRQDYRLTVRSITDHMNANGAGNTFLRLELKPGPTCLLQGTQVACRIRRGMEDKNEIRVLAEVVAAGSRHQPKKRGRAPWRPSKSMARVHTSLPCTAILTHRARWSWLPILLGSWIWTRTGFGMEGRAHTCGSSAESNPLPGGSSAFLFEASTRPNAKRCPRHKAAFLRKFAPATDVHENANEAPGQSPIPRTAKRKQCEQAAAFKAAAEEQDCRVRFFETQDHVLSRCTPL